MLYRRAIFVDEMRILCRIIGGSHTIKSYSKLTPSKISCVLDKGLQFRSKFKTYSGDTNTTHLRYFLDSSKELGDEEEELE